MITSDKEILYISSVIENAVDRFHNFWPMTGFIHHNPLHGFEHLPFEEAVTQAQALFHSKKFLTREQYQCYLAEGKVHVEDLREEIVKFGKKKGWEDEKLAGLLLKLATKTRNLYPYDDVHLPKNHRLFVSIEASLLVHKQKKHTDRLARNLIEKWTLCDSVDALFDTNFIEILNEKSTKTAMQFLDEGQAGWNMPNRGRGMYQAWKEAVIHDRVYFKRDEPLCRLLQKSKMPEDIIYWVITELKIPRSFWESYFTLKFSKQHGWTGFLRWRSKNSSYKYQKSAPAYMEEFLAIRLYYTYMLLKSAEKICGFFPDLENMTAFLQKPEAIMRYLYFSGQMLESYVMEMQEWLKREEKSTIESMYERYLKDELGHQSRCEAEYLCRLLEDESDEIQRYFQEYGYQNLLDKISEFEENEGFLWLYAMEQHYLRSLMHRSVQALESIQSRSDPVATPDAQLFFCIDVRSESIRRAVECVGAYETFGIAGFFGVPLKFIDIKREREADLCPAIVKPKNIIYKFEPAGRPDSGVLLKTLKHIYHDLKYDLLSPYITVETIGILFGFDFLGKTIWPNRYMPFRKKLFNECYEGDWMIEKYSREEIIRKIVALQAEIIKRAVKEKFGIPLQDIEAEIQEIRTIATSKEPLISLEAGRKNPKTRFGKALGLMHYEEIELIESLQKEYKISYHDMRNQIDKMAKVGFTFKEQLFYARNALKIVGLSDNFAPVVAFLGHKSESENNPYESALDCGACGGKSSDVNARVLAYLANKKTIREALQKEGVFIPDNTVFVHGVHNTVTDEVTLDRKDIDSAHTEAVAKMQHDLDEASKISAYERSRKLPFARHKEKKKALKFMRRNKMDWSQTRPEWGLSKNHSFFIGKRELTREIPLYNRSFLHSYDHAKDPHGYYLEIILSGALVVGEWINMEHFFSAVDNVAFGSESKVYHNVVGKFGVISGNLSDLRTGLAAQSVQLDGKPYHEPIRLISIIDAPFEKCMTVVNRIHKVYELVYNGWVRMVFLDRDKEMFYYYSGEEEGWKKVPFEEAKKEKR